MLKTVGGDVLAAGFTEGRRLCPPPSGIVRADICRGESGEGGEGGI